MEWRAQYSGNQLYHAAAVKSLLQKIYFVLIDVL